MNNTILLIFLLILPHSRSFLLNAVPQQRLSNLRTAMAKPAEVAAQASLIASLALAPSLLPVPAHAAPYLSKPVQSVIMQMERDSSSKEYMEDFEVRASMK